MVGAHDETVHMPETVDLGDGLVLRRATATHADAVARAVRESLEHLAPFMPWAVEVNTRPAVQHARLVGVERLWTEAKEYQFVVCPADESDDRVLGGVGLLGRDRWGVSPHSTEIGYWVHVDWCRRGIATRSSRALTEASFAALGATVVVIACDEANLASNDVPRKLGFAHDRTIDCPPEAPGETGHLRIWTRTEEAG
ncbi:MAG TPA: GNAT family protein [Acidimicrobiia bacterium]|nr:GNAT family protein [Acidimicrobiia bacterium]